MSEPILKAIIQLFALAAKESGVSVQEKDRIKFFLSEHLDEKAVVENLLFFDQCAKLFSEKRVNSEELDTIVSLCSSINQEMTQKQKTVIILELMSIMLADGDISDKEKFLANAVGDALNIEQSNIDLIEMFLLGTTPSQMDYENILIIDDNSQGYSKAKHIYREGLKKGFIAFMYIRAADIYFFGYVGTAEIFLNGIPKKPRSLNVMSGGGTLKWEGANPIYYGDVFCQFHIPDPNSRLSFEAKDICCQFNNGSFGIDHVSIAEESGRLVAIMGGSGTGKSTLIHALSGISKISSGKILINGIDIHEKKETIKGLIGFVPQDDMLIEELTVYQNLYFATQFCFNQLTAKEIDDLVITTLESVGLVETKDLKVGSIMKKTISGGQRKRLNIALELLRKPAILFCDEPTSGLSSSDSEKIIKLLKELSLKGNLVFSVIHQPSSDIFKMMDKLIILDVGGKPIYYGNPVDAITYFKRSIELIKSEQGECPSCGNMSPEQIFEIIETNVVNEYGEPTGKRKFSSSYWSKKYKKQIKIDKVSRPPDRTYTTLQIPNWFKQIKLFSQRDSLTKKGNTQYVLINLLEAPLLACIISFIVRYNDNIFDTSYVFNHNVNIPVYLFMSIIAALFMGLTVSAEGIIRDRAILKREAFLYLSRSSYIIAKMIVLFAISSVQTLLYVSVGHLILEIKDVFFIHWLILFTTSCFANILGLNISSAFNSIVTIYIIIPLLLIPQLLLSGVVINFDKLNPAVGDKEATPAIGNLMTSRWAFEAAMTSQFTENKYEKIFYDIEQRMAESLYKKNYYIPTLQSKLEKVHQLYHVNGKRDQAKIEQHFNLLQNELTKESWIVGKSETLELKKLNITKYDSNIYKTTKKFLDVLKHLYNKRYQHAMQKKDSIISMMTSTPKKKKAFKKLKDNHRNEAVINLVKNITEKERIIEVDEKLIQKIFPIYKDPDPSQMMDIDTQFYVSKKRFMGYNIDTWIFNIVVIWMMVIILTFLLYYEVLHKLVNSFNRFGKKKSA